MKKILAFVLAAVMLLAMTACGSQPASAPEATPSPATEPTPAPAPTPTPDPTPEPTPEPPSAEKVAIGDTISLDFVEITIDEAGISDNIQQEIKSGYTTYIHGPDPEEGKMFVYLRGTITNLDAEPISSVNIGGSLQMGKYSYDVDRIDMYEDSGNWAYSIDPLFTYNYTIYVSIPSKLAETGESCTMTLGFKDLFEYITSDEEATYQYSIDIA